MIDTMKQFETFSRSLKYYGIGSERNEIDSLQLHLGCIMNQGCIDDDTSPDNKEISRNTIVRIVDLLKQNKEIKKVYISVENFELSQDIKFLIESLKELDIKIIYKYERYHIMDESYISTAKFLANHRIDIIASKPGNQRNNEEEYSENEIDFTKSIDALKFFNKLGYGIIGSELELNLEYIPTGIKLRSNPDLLETEYKKQLKDVHGIYFNHLLIRTNMAINQYAHKLMEKGEFTNYCNLLFSAFDCRRADKINCKHQISINWKGELFDCEHNLSMEIPVCSDKITIWDILNFQEVTNNITFARHCYGCTARCGRY